MAPAHGRRLASKGGSGNHALPSARSGGRAGAMGAKGMGTWLFLFFSDGADGMETCGWSRGGDKGLLLRAQGSCLRRMHPLPGASVMRGQMCQKPNVISVGCLQENYRHSINDDVLWWSQKLDSDPPSVMTAISLLQPGSDEKQAVIVIM
uniref:Uncharacterized protein n=2 Tax=Oryza sativa subsp. japonica TaxID=39947 RepID=A0A5S6R6Z6_ORYSJ|nr:Hypothetical protein [Oryza sativa Japonica Group]AAP52357.1 hypothetical protein LOC_Os10g09200 [Oryza sativa Japonica Group]